MTRQQHAWHWGPFVQGKIGGVGRPGDYGSFSGNCPKRTASGVSPRKQLESEFLTPESAGADLNALILSAMYDRRDADFTSAGTPVSRAHFEAPRYRKLRLDREQTRASRSQVEQVEQRLFRRRELRARPRRRSKPMNNSGGMRWNEIAPNGVITRRGRARVTA